MGSFFKYFTVLLIALFVYPPLASADEYDLLFAEFDARPLQLEEKRLLQASLALQGHYRSLLDGKWGGGSQAAIERYTAENYELEPLNLHMATLVIGYIDSFETEGWAVEYLPELAMSLILPKKTIVLEKYEDGFYYWSSSTNSLTIIASSVNNDAVALLHNESRRNHSYLISPEPYLIDEPNRIISSTRLSNGRATYIRSEYLGGNWSTILVASSQEDLHLLNMVSTSLTIGGSNDLSFPSDGYLDHIISLTFDLIETTESRDTSNVSETTSDLPSSGTGFYVDHSGSLLTNAHVIEGCRNLRVEGSPFHVVAKSAEFDLALLQPNATMNQDQIASFAQRPAKLNADVTVIGYPLHGLLGGLNVTRGAVTSLTGISGDSKTMQISAPVQPGNSGGPVLDKSGNIIGVVVSKLDSLLIADTIGDIPQNINFAIRGELAKLFLGTNGIEYAISEVSESIPPTELAEKSVGYTVLIECN